MFSMVIGITKYYHNDVILFRNKYYIFNFQQISAPISHNETAALRSGETKRNAATGADTDNETAALRSGGDLTNV
jgi:hypothetical protein